MNGLKKYRIEIDSELDSDILLDKIGKLLVRYVEVTLGKADNNNSTSNIKAYNLAIQPPLRYPTIESIKEIGKVEIKEIKEEAKETGKV